MRCTSIENQHAILGVHPPLHRQLIKSTQTYGCFGAEG
ncbi:uncharacterized protein METZ01_LOCUS258717, partial [marine metagenome]